jgi:hypothetical protein
MISLPSSGRWQSSQNGDTFGSIVRSKNASLDREGMLEMARKAMALYSLDDDAGFGTPTVMETDGTYLYVLTTDGHCFVIDLTADFFSIVETSGTNSPTLGLDSDMVIFNDKPHASGGAKVGYLNAFGQGQLWHNPSPITDLSTDFPHPLCVRERAGTLLVGDGNVVRQYSAGYSRDTDNELTLPASYIVTGIRTNGSNIYLATRHRYGGTAKLFVWNGAGTANQAEYPIGADWAYSMEIYQSAPTVITSAGQIKRFNGGGFDAIANLPVYYTPYSWTSTAADTSLVGKVASRGMRALGDILYINIDGSLNNDVAPGAYLPEQPSGLWVLDPRAGLYHKAGYNHQSNLRQTVSDLNSSYLSVPLAHQAELGDAVLYTGTLTGLTSGQVYYAIPDSATTMRLALTPQDAVAGKHLAVTGTPSSDRLITDRYESMGHTAISVPGGVCVFGRNAFNGFYGSEAVFGGAALDETLSAKGVLMSLGMGRNAGTFVTPRIESAAIADTIQKIGARFRPLALDTDKLVIKYRTRKRYGSPSRPITIAWTSSTAFTVDTTLYDFSAAQEGDEVEIIAGAGAGYTAHITAINTDSSTYAVTIDESLPVSAADTAMAFVDNWTKLTTLTKDTESNAAGYFVGALGETSPWAQLKIEMRGANLAVRLLQFMNTAHQ